MRTVIVRLAGSALDGHLHGVAEVVGLDQPVPFADEGSLLAVLHAVAADATSGTVADLNST